MCIDSFVGMRISARVDLYRDLCGDVSMATLADVPMAGCMMGECIVGRSRRSIQLHLNYQLCFSVISDI